MAQLRLGNGDIQAEASRETVVRKLYGTGACPTVLAFVATRGINELHDGNTWPGFDFPRPHHFGARLFIHLACLENRHYGLGFHPLAFRPATH